MKKEIVYGIVPATIMYFLIGALIGIVITFIYSLAVLICEDITFDIFYQKIVNNIKNGALITGGIFAGLFLITCIIPLKKEKK